MDGAQRVVETVRSNLPVDKLPSIDEGTLQRLKEQAIARARQLQQQAVNTAAASAQHANAVARDVATSRSAGEAGSKLWIACSKLGSSQHFAAFARALVCIYFLNLVYDDLEAWWQNDTPEMRQEWAMYIAQGGPMRKPGFPWLECFVLMPCAFAAAAGIKVSWTATALVIDMAYDSSNLIVTNLLMFFVWGQKPDELMVKKLGMFGCAALVLASAVKDSIPANSYAGLLLQGRSKEKIGWRKSLVLLLGRLLMALLFIYVGVTQVQRVIARDFVLHMRHDVNVPLMARKDGHDNNWLLLEFALSLPFAVGFKTAAMARLLALTMVAEALTCWNFLQSWPTWQYASHVRSHFFTNFGVAGGLLLLQTFGAGMYTIDNLISKKRQ